MILIFSQLTGSIFIQIDEHSSTFMLTLLPVTNVNSSVHYMHLCPFENVFTVVSNSPQLGQMSSVQLVHMFRYEHTSILPFFDSLCNILVVFVCSPLKCVNHVDFRKQAGISDSKMTTKSCVLLVRCQIYTVAQLHVHLQVIIGRKLFLCSKYKV